ncbi:MAG: sulfotransferase domain-containing protein [Proteobacteria bacterium]|nr:sulfotransferase domain-containing protein [Pseudomonadota bacterium]
MNYPQLTHSYENHHLDSPRWAEFDTRPDDIIISTSYKSGTTWMQTIIANLLFQDGDIPGAIMEMSPWVDMRIRPFDDIQQTAAAQTHRRFLKTHLPLDGIPYKTDLKYIYVGRDLRDVFMSVWNHYSGHSDAFFEAIASTPYSFPRCPEDIHEFWHGWINKSSFEWESDGYPYWSSTHHSQTWWDYRHLDNIIFVHYSDLLAQPGAEISRLAEFLDIPISAENLDSVVDATSFKSMKANAENVLGGTEVFWKGGAQRFLFKGSNGRWHDVLSEQELKEYEAMKERTLSPGCAAWLEQGRTALT